MILASSWSNKLHPRLAALEEVLGSRQAVVAAVSKAPNLLCTALDTIKSNFCFLEQLALSELEVQRLTASQPQLLAFRFDSADFQATLRYFESVLGKAPRQMFVYCPSYLKSGLHRVDYKVSELAGLVEYLLVVAGSAYRGEVGYTGRAGRRVWSGAPMSPGPSVCLDGSGVAPRMVLYLCLSYVG